MLALCPDLFWNLWWYSARFNLPLPLPSRWGNKEGEGSSALSSAPPQMLLLAGWDARMVERGAQAAVAALHAFDAQRMGEGWVNCRIDGIDSLGVCVLCVYTETRLPPNPYKTLQAAREARGGRGGRCLGGRERPAVLPVQQQPRRAGGVDLPLALALGGRQRRQRGGHADRGGCRSPIRGSVLKGNPFRMADRI
jgi:hypothetical protein